MGIPMQKDGRTRSWPFFLAGLLLFLLGPGIYFVQVSMHNLTMPWHVPILATLGVALMALSIGKRRGIVRSIGLVFFIILCGLEWFFLLSLTKTPDYVGPAQPGRPIPEFATAYADGSPFTHKDLEDGRRTALIFFRGRW
jgi:hypothetical protein